MNLPRATRTLSITVAFSSLIVASAASSVWHIALTASYPKSDQVLSESPDTIRLWFNEEPELALAGISLEGENGKVEIGRARETDDPKSFKTDVLEQLSPGSYRVAWRAAGSDGHVIRGRYNFEVRAGTLEP
jgi:methionine-rich copper-binding protein CopC